MGGQLTATWILQNGKASNLAGPTDDVKGIRVSRGRKVLATLEAERYPKNAQLVKARGNKKTESVLGMVKSLAGCCFRAGTGFEKCETACYTDEKGCGGCYANHTLYAVLNKNRGYNVVHNGLRPGTEEFAHIRLPINNNYSLDRWGTRLWRVDSETADASLSIALGITQQWARANSGKTFTAISSDYFFCPDSRLRELAALRNVVIGHTLSPWFGPSDQANRVKEIKRFQSFGVPTMVWLATRPDWNVEEQKNLALSLVSENQILEVPYHYGGKSAPHSVHLNPAGACCENHVDSARRLIKNGQVVVDGEKVPHSGRSSGVCAGCRVLCGARYLKTTAQRATAAAC